jgi:hypothetical protein
MVIFRIKGKPLLNPSESSKKGSYEKSNIYEGGYGGCPPQYKRFSSIFEI